MVNVGDSVRQEKTIASSLIEDFGEISGDRNLIHFDDEFASKTVFKKRIAHEMTTVSFISAAITELLGQGNVILNLNIDFKAAIYVGDTVGLTLTVDQMMPNGTVKVSFVIINNQTNVQLTAGPSICLKIY